MPELRRSLSLPLVVLYGLGVTIGAGIYVLLGAASAEAGRYAPMSFVLAAVVMAFSAASFAELSSRYPVSAGEAAYVRNGFQSKHFALLIGCMVILSGVVSSAAITVGSTGYIQEFVDWDRQILVLLIVAIVAGVAAWGILESVTFASLFTLVEAGALIAVIAAGLHAKPEILSELPSLVPPLGDTLAWSGVAAAGLLAFFAFIGFEDIVNLAEEVKQPERTLPWAIFLTLVMATILYFLVTAVAILSVPLEELSQSKAPVSLVFGRITEMSPTAITAIAIVATLNGVIIQIVMASRVLYGLGKQGNLPSVFASINPVTRTPLVATGGVSAVVLILALWFPLSDLAEWTSRIVLVVFTSANAALFMIKRREKTGRDSGFQVPIWVPVGGFLTCLMLLFSDLFV